MNAFTRTSTMNLSQRGFVLIIVLMLIILISGLGLLAVRHSRQEARSTGAYVDSTQAIALVESALAVAITDLRTSPDYYRRHFTEPDPDEMVATGSTGLWDLEYAIKLSDDFYVEGTLEDCPPELGDTDDTDGPQGCVGALTRVNTGNNADYQTFVTYETPLVGPCPPGYSCFDDQNYGWYIFGINVTTRFGTAYSFWNTQFVETARAQGYGRVTIGPIGAFGN